MLAFLLTSIAITVLIAIGLILSQRPVADLRGNGLDFSQLSDAVPLPVMRDGPHRFRYVEASEKRPLAVFVHGSGWHGGQWDALAGRVATDGLADVLVPDLRGHGAEPERRGDVDYIGQLEDDLAELIEGKVKADQKVVMIGHSSGGGLVVRFAGGAHGDVLDHAVLLAPFLKHDAPTTRPNSGGWAHVMTRRIIGLSILNTFKISLLNGLEIIQFRFPDAVLDGPRGHEATRSYSYRLNTSYAPRRDYLSDVAALPGFDLIVGTKDEAFVAEQYEVVMSGATDKGNYVLVPDVKHLGIVNDEATFEVIRAALERLTP